MKNMQKRRESLRSQLLKMSRLSQRAVDYSIKGYELGKPEYSREVLSKEKEFRDLRLSIVDRGRMVLPKEMPVSADSRFTCSALRICHALQNTYDAAAAIAIETAHGYENSRRIDSPVVLDLGKFVNSLVRLCTVALFNEDLQHARLALRNAQGRLWFNLSLRQAQRELRARPEPQANFELAIVENLSQIAERSYEVAHETAMWLEGADCFNPARQRLPHFFGVSLSMRNTEQAGAA